MFDVCLLFSFQGMDGACAARVPSLAFCTPSASGNPFLNAHHVQSDVAFTKILTRCYALAGSRIAKTPLTNRVTRYARAAFLFVSFLPSNVRPFFHAGM